MQTYVAPVLLYESWGQVGSKSYRHDSMMLIQNTVQNET